LPSKIKIAALKTIRSTININASGSFCSPDPPSKHSVSFTIKKLAQEAFLVIGRAGKKTIIPVRRLLYKREALRRVSPYATQSGKEVRRALAHRKGEICRFVTPFLNYDRTLTSAGFLVFLRFLTPRTKNLSLRIG
jgi:hypothetical protein